MIRLMFQLGKNKWDRVRAHRNDRTICLVIAFFREVREVARFGLPCGRQAIKTAHKGIKMPQTAPGGKLPFEILSLSQWFVRSCHSLLYHSTIDATQVSSRDCAEKPQLRTL